MHVIRCSGFGEKAGWISQPAFRMGVLWDSVRRRFVNILIVNDDGIAAKGLRALTQRLAERHSVTVAAPMHQQSGTSHALTIGRAIEVICDESFTAEYGAAAWAIDGTPADCAKIYLDAIAKEPPDVVLSGINHGVNLGTDVIYSGTVGGAFEGLFHGIPSFALSLFDGSHISFDEAAAYFEPFMEKLVARDQHPFLFNINFPQMLAGKKPQFVFCRQGVRDYINTFQRIEHDGRIHYKAAGEISDTDKSMGTDIYAIEHGLIAVTPLGIDMTDYPQLEQFGKMII